jgi:hypothetical protein
MEIADYSRKAIDEYKRHSQHMDQAEAKRFAVYGLAAVAADSGQASIANAAKVARHAIESYETKRNGLADAKAIDGAVKDTTNRFDDRGRDTAMQQERPRSRGMGL